MSLRLPPTSCGPSPNNHPYEQSIASSASSSTSSVFSEAPSIQSWSTASSQSSQQSAQDAADGLSRVVRPVRDDSSVAYARRARAHPASHQTSRSVSHAHLNVLRQTSTWPAGNYASQVQKPIPCIKTSDGPTPSEQCRQHPRRCPFKENQKPPPLIRQTERRLTFVDSLVDSATQMVEVIWPLSGLPCRSESGSGKGVLPLRTFIQETLRRSRTSYSTLQVALYYLVLIKPHVPKCDFTMEQPLDFDSFRALQCGRRMFLAALILASKYLQDRNFSARAWSKISGLKVDEINLNEMAFLAAVKWKLHIADGIFDRWTELVLRYTPSGNPPHSPGFCITPLKTDWKSVVTRLTPDLAGFDALAPPLSPMRNGFQLLTGDMQKLQLPASPTPTREHGGLRSTSGESTPTPSSAIPRLPSHGLLPKSVDPASALPRYLEPRPDLPPPTPSLIRMGPLPTPQLTPSSAASSTPAAGPTSGDSSRRPSMCSAMAQAQQQCFVRTALDHFATSARTLYSDASSLCSRRLSVARSSSSGSSPESMISDNSSRFSRASSISSISSANWAPGQANNLCRLATCRNMKLPYPSGPAPRLRHKQSTSRLAELSELAELTRLNTDVYEKSDQIIEEPVFAEDITSSPEYEMNGSPLQIKGANGQGLSRHTASAPRMDMKMPVRSKEPFSAVEGIPTQPPPPATTSGDCIKRKRGRSSTDLAALHQNVRDMLKDNPTPYPSSTAFAADASCGAEATVVAPDTVLAQSFLLPAAPPTYIDLTADTLAKAPSATSSFGSSNSVDSPLDVSPGPKALQSPSRSDRCGDRRPVCRQDRAGRKRACCDGTRSRDASFAPAPREPPVVMQV